MPERVPATASAPESRSVISPAQISYLASKEVFAFLGAAQKTGLHYRRGPHAQNEEDWAALLDFADWQLLGKKTDRKFDELPFLQFPPAFQWKALHPAE